MRNKGLLIVLTGMLPVFLAPASGFAQCGYSATIGTNKDYCTGSTLHVHSTHSMERIVWYANGQKVKSVAASKYLDTNGITVAGGVGWGGENDQINPAGIAVDPAGNLYVADPWKERVMKWAPGATNGTLVAGGNGFGTAANQLSDPETIFVDQQGNLYVSDLHNGTLRIQKFTPGETNGTTVFSYTSSDDLDASSFYVDCSGNLYLAGENHSAILRFAPGADLGSGFVVAGGKSSSAANFDVGDSPFWLDGQRNIFFLDAWDTLIAEWPAGAKQGKPLATVSDLWPSNGDRGSLYVDGTDTVYLAYQGQAPGWCGIKKIAPDGSGGTIIGGNGYGDGADQFGSVMGKMVMDNEGSLYVSDPQNFRVQKFVCHMGPIDTVYAPAAPGKYWAVVTDLQGFSQATDTIYIGEPDAGTPSISVTASTTSAPVCEPINFTAQVTNPGATPYYQWMVSGVPAGGDSTTYSYNLFANGDEVYCILSTPAGCTGALLADTSNIVTLKIDPQGAASVTIDASKTMVCAGDPVSFDATVQNGAATPVFSWMVNGVKVSGDDGATYTTDSLWDGSVVNCVITSDDVCGLAKSNSIPIEVDSRPVIAPGQVFYMAFGKGVQLDAQISGNPTSWLWSPGTGLSDPTIADPLANPAANTVYTLEVSTPAGCSDNAKIIVEVYTPLQMPNAFTPNGDGHNDRLYVLGGPGNSVVEQFVLFDRWGQEVYKVKDAAPGDAGQGWDGRIGGRDAPAGAYVYMIVMRYAGGGRQIYKGVVELIR